jgi:putative toxin-antitoxin system antitoxin component (TIGR02293 family)
MMLVCVARWIGSRRMQRRADPSRSQITSTRPSRRTLVEWPFSKDSYAYLAAQASDSFPPGLTRTMLVKFFAGLSLQACGPNEFIREYTQGSEVAGMQARTGAAVSFLELISAFPSPRAEGFLRQTVGISERTLKGLVSKDPGAALTLEQSKRVQQVSEILFQATMVLGSVAAADAWVTRKAIGLDNKTPLEMMMTPEGSLALRDQLVRIEYGVYC